MKLPLALPENQSSLKYQLQQALAEAVNSLQGKTLQGEEVKLERPAREEHGDWTTNIAMAIFVEIKNQKEGFLRNAKIKNTSQNSKLTKPFSPSTEFIPSKVEGLRAGHQQFNNPFQFAQAIVEKLKGNKLIQSIAGKIEALPPGFINISINNQWLVNQLGQVLKEGGNYGWSTSGRKKKIMVEFAQANTHKLFHIGHLRNISTGEAVVRILEAAGVKVVRANYQGDVGMHIAKCLYGILQSQKSKVKSQKCKLKVKNLDEKINFLGKCYIEGNKAYEEDEKAKQEIIEINKKIYDRSDPKINQLWQETRSWSLAYFDRIYQRVDSHFDRYYFESEVFRSGKAIVEQFLTQGKVFQKSKGAIIFPGSKYGLHDRVFINSEGNATYEAKDVGLAQLQFKEYQPDLILHVVAPEQTGYFEVLFKALEQVFPQTKAKEFHLKYGWVRLKEGKMSSRTGQVVLAEWLLDEAKSRVKKIMAKTVKGKLKPEEFEQVAETVAVAGAKYAFLKQGVDKDIAFDFEESVSLEGNSGPYLLYTYARAKSVLAHANFQFSIFNPSINSGLTLSKVEWVNFQSIFNDQFSINQEEKAVLRSLSRFPEVVRESAQELAPNVICTYLYDLCQKFNLFYNKHRIIESTMKQLSNETINFRLALTTATSQILKNGLNLLGIKTAEKM